MISIFDYNRKIRSSTNALISQFKDFLLNSEELVIFLQQQQLNEGENKEGKLIGVYSAFTEIITNGRKKAGEPYNFQDTGSFFEGMFIKVETSPEFAIIIDSSDSKTKELEEEYTGLLGLNKENTEVLSRQITDLFIRFINRKILQNV